MRKNTYFRTETPHGTGCGGSGRPYVWILRTWALQNRGMLRYLISACAACGTERTIMDKKYSVTYVTKRNGDRVPFDAEKIKNAVMKANREQPERLQLREEDAVRVTEAVAESLRDGAGVEEIQNAVVTELISAGFADLASSYEQYRALHSVMRSKDKVVRSVWRLIKGENEELKTENSNKDTSVNSTQRDYMAGELSKEISAMYLYPPHIMEAVRLGELHLHDQDYQVQNMFNCCLVNIGDMLMNGTVMNGKMVERPHTFRVAATVATQIMAAVASNQYGGQSVDCRHFGYFLRRTYERAYAKRLAVYEKRGFAEEEAASLAAEDARAEQEEDLKAGVQTMQYQINTIMTTNGQAPFVTLFLNIDEADEYADENAQIVAEILRQRIQGIKNEQGVYVTPAFPKLIYVLYPWNNLTGGKYDWVTEIACECSAKRMYPDYISSKKMKENYEGNVFSCMGCRSFLSPWKDADGNYKFEGRFNQGVVSINLPQIGIIAGGDEEKFWPLLDERLELCYEALMIKHKLLRGVTSDVSPVHWQYGAIARLRPGEKIDPLLYGGYSTISLGYIGVYEMTVAMKGCSHTAPEGKEFAMRVMQHMKDKCAEWKAKTNIGFAVYGTPAESLCYKFAKIDRERFGDIRDITDKGYYTNSYHVDVREKIDAFAKFEFEDSFQKLSTGGCISYVEIPSLTNNLDAVRELVKYIYGHIQYAEFNTKSDYCHECGYDGEMKWNEEKGWYCPQCGNTDEKKMTVVRRTCGYLGEHFWNAGKTKEINSRVTHL